MNLSQVGQRGAGPLYILTILALIVVGGLAVSKYFFPANAQINLPKSNLSNLVRGYLAVSVGRSSSADSTGGIFARDVDAKQIYLPGVIVFLEDPQTQKRSSEALTDLSGRFTITIPDEGRYRFCWKSKVYGDDCLKDLVSAGREPLFLSTVPIKVPPREGFAASFGKVRFKNDSIPRTLEPLSNINSFAVVSLVDSNKNVLAEVPVNNFGDYLLPY